MRTRASRILLAACVLLCLGLAACHKPHSVTLGWDAPHVPPGASVLGYNVYRSDTSAGPFVKLASRVPAPPYEDRSVRSGHTYFYVVTALDQAGRESKFSQQIQAKIP
ncbi:MAG: fibronectin type III domain-containing protein [Terriglobales bacterium]|jgi:fibronectin type 3 domain-containing protein